MELMLLRVTPPRLFVAFPPLKPEEEKKVKKIISKLGRENVYLSVQVVHQVEIGESMEILGSTRELGSWMKNVAMD